MRTAFSRAFLFVILNVIESMTQTVLPDLARFQGRFPQCRGKRMIMNGGMVT